MMHAYVFRVMICTMVGYFMAMIIFTFYISHAFSVTCCMKVFLRITIFSFYLPAVHFIANNRKPTNTDGFIYFIL